MAAKPARTIPPTVNAGQALREIEHLRPKEQATVGGRLYLDYAHERTGKLGGNLCAARPFHSSRLPPGRVSAAVGCCLRAGWPSRWCWAAPGSAPTSAKATGRHGGASSACGGGGGGPTGARAR